jgi:hypothetical protein
MNIVKAVKKANLYIEAGIKTSVDLGRGNGPINHFHSTYTLPFAPWVFSVAAIDPEALTFCRGGFISYLLDREDVQEPWKEYTEHDFVQKMADGSLPVESFRYYMIQDYMFLVSLHMDQPGCPQLTCCLDTIRKSQCFIGIQVKFPG